MNVVATRAQERKGYGSLNGSRSCSYGPPGLSSRLRRTEPVRSEEEIDRWIAAKAAERETGARTQMGTPEQRQGRRREGLGTSSTCPAGNQTQARRS